MLKKIWIMLLSTMLTTLMVMPNMAAMVTDDPGVETAADAALDRYYTFDETTGTLTFHYEQYGYTEINLGDYATYFDMEKVKHIVIPEGYKSVWCNGGERPINLETVQLPASLTIIGQYTFYGCNKLEAITIPENVTIISYNAFSECTSLKEINFPEGLTTIRYNAFSGCSSLETVTLPDSLTTIEERAFEKCINLKNITFPKEITGLAGYLFSNCTSLESITIPEKVTKLDASIFRGCTSLKNVMLPEGLEIVQGNVFTDCTSLETITFPDTVTSVSADAFYKCPHVTVICSEEVAQYLDSSVSNVQPNQEVYQGGCGYGLNWIIDVSANTLSIKYNGGSVMADYTNRSYPGWYNHRNLIHKIMIDEGVESIGNYAFANLGNLVEVTIPSTVKTIGDAAFMSCVFLDTIEIPKNTSSIGSSCFSNCDSLAKVDILSDTIAMGEMAFANCSLLYEFKIVADDVSVGKNAFVNCNKLTDIVFPGKSLSLGDHCLDLTSLRNVTIMAPNPTLGTSVFSTDNQSLTINGFDGSLTEYAGENSHFFVKLGYVITFDDSNEGGSLKDATKTEKGVNYNTAAGELLPVDTDDGYEFKGWYTQKIGGEEITEETVISENMTVYAQWESKQIPTPTPTTGPTPSASPTPGGNPTISPAPTTEPSVVVHPDGSKVETKIETKANGTVNTIEKETKANGDIKLHVVSTSKDKQKQTIVDLSLQASGQLQNAAIEVANMVQSKKMTINLTELKALSDQVAAGNIEYVHPIGDAAYNQTVGAMLGAMKQSDSDLLGVTQKTANVNIKISARDNSGNNKYTVSIQKKDLSQNKFVVYKNDKNNNAVMVNQKNNNVKVSPQKDLALNIAKKGSYQLQNTKDAAKTDKKIVKTVIPQKTNVTVKQGQKTSFTISKKCNTANISKVTYSANNANVKVDKKGKIQASSTGSSKVTANVTLQNGTKKKISMNVKVS